jgi:D-cysteine desulfhydrase
MIPLFYLFPSFREKLPHVALGDFPTPVHLLSRIGEIFNTDTLFIKRDDLSGRLFGGNKIRKLEFFLGQARQANACRVLTFGYAGSNHTLATALYAQTLGLRCTCMLLPQLNAEYVRQNLLKSYHCGAELHMCRTVISGLAATAYQLLRHRLRSGRFPKIIPAGGSSPLGALGYVNAAFELLSQINSGLLPEPDFIFVPLGTAGTAVGLMLGVQAANLKSQVISVSVVKKHYATATRIKRLFAATNSILHAMDQTFPLFSLSTEAIHIRHGYFGGEYARFTEAGLRAASLLYKHEGIKLDGTYTSKAFAALLDDVKNPEMKNKVVLFWNTCNSRDFSEVVKNVDYRQLGRSFHRYFEEAVQPWIDNDVVIRQNSLPKKQVVV